MKSLIIFTLILFNGVVCAQDTAADFHLDNEYGDAFVRYEPYIVPAKKAPEEVNKSTSTSKAQPEKKEGEQKVDVAWLRKNYPKLEENFINNPNETNTQAFGYVKRIVLDKAQRSMEAYRQFNFSDPVLNENNRIPYASAGAWAVQRADINAQINAIKELSTQGGLLVFVDGVCRHCATQLPVVTSLKNNYGLESLVISIDGTSPAGYLGPILKDNGLWSKLKLKLTPSIVYVHHPKGYNDGADPNKYLIVAQGFYTQPDLVKQIAYAAYTSHYLSENTMRDLHVWDRGVASTRDLNKLTLDPNKPEEFKNKLQPLLLKQYE